MDTFCVGSLDECENPLLVGSSKGLYLFMKYHKTTQIIIVLLKEKGVWFQTFEHDPVTTSIEAAKVRPGYTLEQGAKALIIRAKRTGKDKVYVMVVMPADKRFDNDKVKKLLDAKDIRFATEDEIAELTDGIKVGGIPPFGNLFGIAVIADDSIFNNEKIVFNAGDRGFSVAMKAEDYKTLVNPRLETIIQE